MNPPQSTLTVEDDTSTEAVVFDGNISSIRLNGEELKTSDDIHRSISTLGLQLTEVDEFFQEQHRKTRADIAERDERWKNWALSQFRKSSFILTIITLFMCAVLGTVLWVNHATTHSFMASNNIAGVKHREVLAQFRESQLQIEALQKDASIMRRQIYKLHLVRMKEFPFHGEVSELNERVQSRDANKDSQKVSWEAQAGLLQLHQQKNGKIIQVRPPTGEPKNTP